MTELTPEQQRLALEVQNERDAIGRLFQSHDGQMVLKHLQEIFSRSTSIKYSSDGAVDSMATLVCEGSRQVVIYIEECLEDDD